MSFVLQQSQQWVLQHDGCAQQAVGNSGGSLRACSCSADSSLLLLLFYCVCCDMAAAVAIAGKFLPYKEQKAADNVAAKKQ